MILTIFCIVFLMAVGLFFINDSRIAQQDLERMWNSYWNAEDEVLRLSIELDKWKRPRGKNGRFTK